MSKEFRLNYILFKNSQEFGRHFYNFSLPGNIHSKAAYTTIIIGSNGTGKSRLLKAIVDIFNDLNNLKNYNSDNHDKLIITEAYEIQYIIGSNVFMINFDGNKHEAYIDGVYSKIEEIILPDACIAAAYTLHEKFIMNNDTPSRTNKYSNKYKPDFYNYLGVKTQNNYAFSSANINKALDLITEAISTDGFNKDIQNVFKFLNFSPAITITYDIRKHHRLFIEPQTIESLRNADRTIMSKSSFSYNTVRNISTINDESILQEIANAINQISRLYHKDRKFAIDIVFKNNYDNSEIISIYKYISTLRKFNLINYEKTFVYKTNSKDLFEKKLELKSLSSGEIHILTSLLSLASAVKSNSIVLIDEPELSLHPNWQIRYMDLINKLFKHSSGCHFIIATHSHFLVSDLIPDSSAILALIIDKHGNFRTETTQSAYGWSAESILYNIFGVSTARNHYFEMDLNKMLKLISEKSKNKEKIMKYVNRLDRFRMPENDPLSLLITEAKNYVAKL